MEKGLEIEVRTRTIHGQEGAIQELVGANPIQWLASPPEGYAGSCKRERAPGEWCFDAVTHEVVYRPRLDGNLEYRDAGKRELRWRVGSSGEIYGKQSPKTVSGGPIGLYSTTSFVWH
jgi:hypothetical protein